jgi:hypothetical protein
MIKQLFLPLLQVVVGREAIAHHRAGESITHNQQRLISIPSS